MKNQKTESQPIVIHMGKKKKKQIKKYHKGKGSMFEEVKATIEQLKKQYQDTNSIQPVVVISKKKQRNLISW